MKDIFGNLVTMIRLVIGVAWATLLFGALTVSVAIGGIIGLLWFFVEPNFRNKIDKLTETIIKWCNDQV